MSMNICGCGGEFKCLKTGLTIADANYNGALQAADFFGCRECGSTHFVANTNRYFPSADVPVIPDVEIVEGIAFYSKPFLAKLTAINGDLTKYKLPMRSTFHSEYEMTAEEAHHALTGE